MDIQDSGLRGTLRRVVTGLDDEGQSTVIIDGGAGSFSEVGISGIYEIWNDTGQAMARREHTDRAANGVILEPDAGGIRVRWFSIAPYAPGTSTEEQQNLLDAAFKEMNGTSAQVRNAQHPGMHETSTIDVVVVVSGSVRLVLEQAERVLTPGDVVVQRGTNHAWEVLGDEPFVGLAVLIHRSFAN